MVTFAAAAARDTTSWVAIITIEGIGSQADGLWKFCSQVPDYAAGNAAYKDWLTDWPDHLGERAPRTSGGIVELGDLGFDVLDYSDLMIGQMKIQGDAATVLTNDVAAGDLSFIVNDATPFTIGTSSIFVGNEAMFITNIVGSTLTVTRGDLGTDAAGHDAGDLAYSALPYLRSRRVVYYLAPQDGTDATTETEQGTFYLSKAQLAQAFNTWHFSAKSQAKYLARQAARKRRTWAMETVYNDVNSNLSPHVHPTLHWPGEDIWLKIDDEIIFCQPTWGVVLRRNGRRQLGTKQVRFQPGMSVSQIMAADTSGPASFRWSNVAAGPSETRAAGFVESAHWIDILLCILTSSADAADGLELVNYDASYGNWSSLPPGYGIGTPSAKIDWASFLDVKYRTPDWIFQNFWFGDEPVDFAELFSAHFAPLGAYIAIRGGLTSIVLPRAPRRGASGVALTTASIMRREVGEDQYELDVDHEVDTGSQIGAVTYLVTGPDGREVGLTVNNESFTAQYGQGGYYGTDDPPASIKMPSLRSDVGGTESLIEQLAMRLLYKYRFPPHLIRFVTYLSLYATKLGELLDFTVPELPDFAAGTRGWTNVIGVPYERSLALGPDGRGGTYEWRAECYGDTGFGLISPAARVASVAGPAAGNYTATCTQNRYTHTDGANAGLPIQDALAFVATDVVRLLSLDGQDVGAGTQIVQSVAGNDIVVDGNFGGALVGDTIIVYANRGEATAAQYGVYTFYADELTNTVGATTDKPWRYGQP